MSAQTLTEDLVAGFARQRPLRAGSLLVTVFGDAVRPRGGTVWLGSLIDVVDAFGISARLVRTSVSRLVKDDWLQSEQVGRRSFYRLSANGRARFDQATSRIYSPPRDDWSGQVQLAVLTVAEAERRELARRELAAQGYRALSATLMASAGAATEAPALSEPQDAVLLGASPSDELQTARLGRLIHQRWELADLASRYAQFVAMFEPVRAALDAAPAVSGELAFRLRTMLIHEYRKVLLRDPRLPPALLPDEWPGASAYEICRALYLHTHAPADAYISEHMEAQDGRLPPPDRPYYRRFGGLPAG